MAAPPCLNVTFAELLCRIRGEYLEMPDLRLTAPQAQRLFGLDSATWDAVSAALLDARVLSHAPHGVFALGSNTGVEMSRISGIGVVADENFTSVDAALHEVDRGCAASPLAKGLSNAA